MFFYQRYVVFVLSNIWNICTLSHEIAIMIQSCQRVPSLFICHQYTYTDMTTINWLKQKLESWFDQFAVVLPIPSTRRREALSRSISKAMIPSTRRREALSRSIIKTNLIVVLRSYSIKFIFIHLFLLLPIANDCSGRSHYHNRFHHENQHIRNKHDDTDT